MINNPMMQMLNQNRISQSLTPVKNMINTLRSAGNPQMMLQQMASQNPQLSQVMDYVKKNGGDPKAAFYKMAEETGVNPDEILGMLNS